MTAALLAGLLVALPAAAPRAVDWKDVKREVERNSAAIKTLRGEVEITLTMPSATLSDKFRILYKNPGLLKIASLSHPASYMVQRRDTTFASPESKQRQSAMLMNSVQLDKQGMLFNLLSGMADAVAKSSACGEDVCFSIEKEVARAPGGTVGDTALPKSAATNLVYSPRTKCIKEVVTASGPGLSRTTLEYQEVRGIRVPKSMTFQTGAVGYRMVFKNIALNQKVTDQEFR